MGAIRRICCGVDFSPLSHRALEEAADLAGRTGAGLTVVHVEEPVQVGPEVVFAPPPILEEEGAESNLGAWRSDAERLLGRTVSSVMLSGPPASALARYAEETGADLVVVASHGRRGVRRLVLGSVAEQVVRQAHCNVLVVRRDLPPEAREGDEASGMPA